MLKKKNQRVRVKLMSAEFLICACGHLVLLSLGTVTFLSSLCWCFIPLPLWLSHWHLNAAFWLLTPFSFFLFISLCIEVCWNRNLHHSSVSANRNITQSHSLISQWGQAPSAPRSCGEQEFGPLGSMECSASVTRKYRQMLWSALSRRNHSQWPRTCHNYIYNFNVIMVW